MSDQSFWYLENIDVTGIFCPQKLGNATDQHVHKSFKKGDYIYLQEDHSDRLFFLMDGRVKIGHFSAGGKEITKAILTKGEVFGELSLIGENKRRDFALAMEDTTVCALTVDEMRNMMREHNGLNLFLMKIMGSRVLEMEQRLESLVFKDSRTRIIEFLANLADKRGQRVGYEMVVRKFMTHQEIANLTATSRQTVTTVLNEMRNKDILIFDRRRLLIRDMGKLREQVRI